MNETERNIHPKYEINSMIESCKNCSYSCGKDVLYCTKHNRQVNTGEICFEYLPKGIVREDKDDNRGNV